MKIEKTKTSLGFLAKVNERYPNINYVLLIVVFSLLGKLGSDLGAFDGLFAHTKTERRTGGRPFQIDDDGKIVVDGIAPGEQVGLSYQLLYEYNSTVPAVQEFMSIRDRTLLYPTLSSTPARFQEMLSRDAVKQYFYETVYDEVMFYVATHDLHPAYENSPGIILNQIALETGWLQKIDEEFLRHNNILGLKWHHDGGVEERDFFYAYDDCDDEDDEEMGEEVDDEHKGMCKFAIFPSRQACLHAYFEEHLNKPVYMDAIQQASEDERENPLIRMSIVAHSVITREEDGYERTGYATLETYFDRIARMFIEQNNALGDTIQAMIFQQWIGEKAAIRTKLASFPGFRQASRQAQADMVAFVEQSCGYILPNGNRIYYLPHDRSEILAGYGQKYEAVFAQTRDQLIASLDNYEPSRELRKERKKAKEVYDHMAYETVTFEQAKELLRKSHEEGFQAPDRIYLVKYTEGDVTEPMDKLHRDRELGAYGKRGVIIHGSVSGFIDANGNVSNGSRTLSPLEQDLSNLRTGAGRFDGTGSRPQDTYGAIVSKTGLIFQFGYPEVFHGACNGPLSKKVVGFNPSDLLFPIECTQASNRNSVTTMEPLTEEQIAGLARAIAFYKFKFNTDIVVTSADVVRNRFASVDGSLDLLTRGAHTDDLTDTERELLGILTVDEVLDIFYDVHGQPAQVVPRVEALYDNFLENPDDHFAYVNRSELLKRYGTIESDFITLKGPLTEERLGHVIAWQRDGQGAYFFPADHLAVGEDGWMEHIGAGDKVVVIEK